MERASGVRIGTSAGSLPCGLDRCRHPGRAFPWREHETLALRNKTATGVARALSSYGGSEFSAAQKQAEPQFSLNLDVLKDLPRPDDVDGAKAWQGVLAGALVGTVLSLAVTSLKATFVAGVVAAGVSLVPKGDIELEDNSLGLPGLALTGAAVEGQRGLKGQANVRPRTTATVAAASVGAATLVAFFAAKSLPLVLFGTASWITLQKEDGFDLERAVVRSRDYLRTKSLSAPGIAASLLLLQAKKAAVTIGTAIQESLDTDAQQSAGQLAYAGASQPATFSGQSSTGEVSGGVAARPTALRASPEEAQPFAAVDEKLLQQALRIGEEKAKQPLQNVKGQNDDASAADLVTGESTFVGKESVLEGSKGAPQGPSSPLQTVKGQNKDASADKLIDGEATFSGKESVLGGSKQAPQGPSSPLQNLKGQNKDARAADLTNSVANFKPLSDTDSVLESSKATGGVGGATPLQSLKGGSTSPLAVRAAANDGDLLGGSNQSPNGGGRQAGGARSSVLRLQTSAGAGKVLQAAAASSFQPAAVGASLGADRPQKLASQKPIRASPMQRSRTPSLMKGFGGDLASKVASFTGRARTAAAQGGEPSQPQQQPAPANRPHSVPSLKPVSAAGSSAGTSPARGQPIPSLMKGFGMGAGAGRRRQAPQPSGRPQPEAPKPSQPGNRPHDVPRRLTASPQSSAGSAAGSSPAQKQPIPTLMKGFGLGVSAGRRQGQAPVGRPQPQAVTQRPQPQPANRPHDVPQKLTASLQTAAGSAAGSSPAQRQPIPGLMRGFGMPSSAGQRRPRQQQQPAPAKRPQLQPQVAKPPAPANRPHSIPSPQKLAAAMQAARPGSAQRPPVPSLMRGLGMAPTARIQTDRTRERAAPGQTPARVQPQPVKLPPQQQPARQPSRLSPLEKVEKQKAAAAVIGGAAPKQKRTAVERWLIAAGSGAVASLGGLVWQLVNGAQLADPIPKLLLACVFACMLAVLLLVTLGQRRPQQPQVAPAGA